jgi:uncharacterized heparinase superfamily protein
LVIAPTLDRYADPEAVKNTLNTVSGIYTLYGKRDNLQIQTPLEINRMTADMNNNVAEFYNKIISSK